MRTVIMVCGVLLFGCESADEKITEEPPSEDAQATQKIDEPVSGKAELALLESSLKPIVVAHREKDHTTRRTHCIKLIEQVQAQREADPDNKKIQAFEGQAKNLCPEIFETQRLMTEAAKPKPEMPKLSGDMAKIFTAKGLRKTLASAKRAVKRKRDPEEHCSRIAVMAQYLESNKRKKTKKLVKRAQGFCSGIGALATIRVRLGLAEQAHAKDLALEVADHCTQAVVKLHTTAASQKRDDLESRAKTVCPEAIAHRGMLQP